MNTTSTGISTLAPIEKEGLTDNIWQTVNTIARLRTQRNYDWVVRKRTIAELERFEEKINEFANEYRNFVDDGVSLKQPRF